MQEQFPQPEVKTSKAAYTVWLLPLVALILAIFLIYKNINERGINVFIEFPDANGIIVKKTAVKFRGIEVGRVVNLTALQDGSGVLASIEMQKDTEPYLTDKLKFWLVRPDVGFSGISGLDTLVSGAYIQVDGGQEVLDGNATRYFKALTGAPQLDIPDEWEVFTLVTNNASGVTTGSLVYHRNIVVGDVRYVKLSDDNQAVEVTVAIEPEFRGLVKMSSRFWNISGVKAQVDMSGVKVQMGGFVPMLVGGIAFSSPPDSRQASEFTEFRLYADADAARDSLEIKLKFDTKAPVSVGSSIMLDNQKVGTIDQLNFDENFESLIGYAKLSVDMAPLMRKDTEFWLESPVLGLDSLDVGGLLRGTIIRLAPGKHQGDKPVKSFDVFNDTPYKRWAQNGLHVSLLSDDASGLSKGSGVFYQSQNIGQVQWIDFDSHSKRFVIDLLIFPRFKGLLTDKSRFYNVSGIELSADLRQGIKVDLPSVGQMLKGGIGVLLGEKSGKPMSEKSRWPLYNNLDTALKSTLPKPLEYTLRSKALLSSNVGAPVFYRQFEIGQVKAVHLAADGQYADTVIAIDPSYGQLMHQDNRFWQQAAVDVEANLAGVKVRAAPLLSLFGGGIEMSRAEQTNLAPHGSIFTLYRNKAEAFDDMPTVELTIAKQTTLKPGAAVKYRGHDVGEVVTTALLSDLSGIRARLKLQPEYAEHFTRQGSQYWLVQPKIRLSGIENVAGAVLGDHIAVEKGQGAHQTQFTVVQANRYAGDGLRLTLKAKQLGSLNRTDPLLYKQLRIGEVIDTELDRDLQTMLITVVVYPQYRDLVNDNCRFWNASGVNVDAGLFSGVQITSETLESIIAGGVAMAIDLNAEQPYSGNSFILHDKAQADWLDGIVGESQN